MNIGAAAERSGLPPKTIRYYEDIGLVRASRALNGYRDYTVDDVHRLKAIASQKLEEIESKIAQLQGLRTVLSHLVSTCHGDHRPDCPIIDDLAGATH
jgi:MerR family transcriptional regulator, copper efflux regulator